MKRHFLFIFLLFSFCTLVFSQDNCIKVIYKVHRSIINRNDSITSPQKFKIREGVNKNIANLKYELYCNSFKSLFFLEEKMELEENTYYKIASIIGGKGHFYKNIKDKIKFKQSEISGHKFNILNDFNEYQWNITKETKIINGFLCYKATTTLQEYDYLRKRANTFSPEAWFTTEISYPFGPNGFDGLPGLVLEASLNSKTIYYATKIEYNTTDCDQILKKPKGGEDISKDDFLKLIAEKSPKS